MTDHRDEYRNGFTGGFEDPEDEDLEDLEGLEDEDLEELEEDFGEEGRTASENETERIRAAATFLEYYARGIHPLDGAPLPERDTARDERVARRLAYAADVLKQLAENEEKRGRKAHRPKRERFFVTAAELADFPYSETPITLSEFCRRLGTYRKMGMKHMSRLSLPHWLVHQGILSAPQEGTRRAAGAPTEKGRAYGFLEITYEGKDGPRKTTVLTLDAQRYIALRVDELMAYRVRGKSRISGRN